MKKDVEIKENINILENELKNHGTYIKFADEQLRQIQKEIFNYKYLMRVLLDKKTQLEKDLQTLNIHENEK